MDLIDESAELLRQLQYYLDTNPEVTAIDLTFSVTNENFQKILQQISNNNSKLYEFFLKLYQSLCAMDRNIDVNVMDPEGFVPIKDFMEESLGLKKQNCFKVIIVKMQKLFSFIRKSGRIQDNSDESVISDSYEFDVCTEIVVWQELDKRKEIELSGIIGSLMDFFEHYNLNNSQKIDTVKKIYAQTCVCNCRECGLKKGYQKSSEFFA